MSNPRTHYVTTTDGVTIGGTVHGQGPSLVFLQGVVGDGDIDWNRVVEHLSGRFTCHLPSLRGRGLSGDHPDLGPGRRVEDVLTYLDGIEQPVGLVGWSGGANMALAVAAQSDAVHAVAAVEPGILSLLEAQEKASLGAAVAHTAELAAGGRPAAAVRALLGWLFNVDEIARAEDAGYLEVAGRYVANMLSLLQQEMEYEGPTADDPAVLGAISAPVLLLLGSETKPYFTVSARHVSEHAGTASVRTIAGAGHALPLTHPAALADALGEFLSPVQPQRTSTVPATPGWNSQTYA